MVMTKLDTLETLLGDEKKTETPAITIDSDEVTRLFGIENTVLVRWVAAGTITPFRSSNGGGWLFWRKDINRLLAAFGI